MLCLWLLLFCFSSSFAKPDHLKEYFGNNILEAKESAARIIDATQPWLAEWVACSSLSIHDNSGCQVVFPIANHNLNCFTNSVFAGKSNGIDHGSPDGLSGNFEATKDVDAKGLIKFNTCTAGQVTMTLSYDMQKMLGKQHPNNMAAYLAALNIPPGLTHRFSFKVSMFLDSETPILPGNLLKATATKIVPGSADVRLSIDLQDQQVEWAVYRLKELWLSLTGVATVNARLSPKDSFQSVIHASRADVFVQGDVIHYEYLKLVGSMYYRAQVLGIPALATNLVTNFVFKLPCVSRTSQLWIDGYRAMNWQADETEQQTKTHHPGKAEEETVKDSNEEGGWFSNNFGLSLISKRSRTFQNASIRTSEDPVEVSAYPTRDGPKDLKVVPSKVTLDGNIDASANEFVPFQGQLMERLKTCQDLNKPDLSSAPSSDSSSGVSSWQLVTIRMGGPSQFDGLPLESPLEWYFNDPAPGISVPCSLVVVNALHYTASKILTAVSPLSKQTIEGSLAVTSGASNQFLLSTCPTEPRQSIFEKFAAFGLQDQRLLFPDDFVVRTGYNFFLNMIAIPDFMRDFPSAKRYTVLGWAQPSVDRTMNLPGFAQTSSNLTDRRLHNLHSSGAPFASFGLEIRSNMKKPFTQIVRQHANFAHQYIRDMVTDDTVAETEKPNPFQLKEEAYKKHHGTLVLNLIPTENEGLVKVEARIEAWTPLTIGEGKPLDILAAQALASFPDADLVDKSGDVLVGCKLMPHIVSVPDKDNRGLSSLSLEYDRLGFFVDLNGLYRSETSQDVSLGELTISAREASIRVSPEKVTLSVSLGLVILGNLVTFELSGKLDPNANDGQGVAVVNLHGKSELELDAPQGKSLFNPPTLILHAHYEASRSYDRIFNPDGDKQGSGTSTSRIHITAEASTTSSLHRIADMIASSLGISWPTLLNTMEQFSIPGELSTKIVIIKDSSHSEVSATMVLTGEIKIKPNGNFTRLALQVEPILQSAKAILGVHFKESDDTVKPVDFVYSSDGYVKVRISVPILPPPSVEGSVLVSSVGVDIGLNLNVDTETRMSIDDDFPKFQLNSVDASAVYLISHGNTADLGSNSGSLFIGGSLDLALFQTSNQFKILMSHDQVHGLQMMGVTSSAWDSFMGIADLHAQGQMYFQDNGDSGRTLMFCGSAALGNADVPPSITVSELASQIGSDLLATHRCKTDASSHLGLSVAVVSKRTASDAKTCLLGSIASTQSNQLQSLLNELRPQSRLGDMLLDFIEPVYLQVVLSRCRATDASYFNGIIPTVPGWTNIVPKGLSLRGQINFYSSLTWLTEFFNSLDHNAESKKEIRTYVAVGVDLGPKLSFSVKAQTILNIEFCSSPPCDISQYLVRLIGFSLNVQFQSPVSACSAIGGRIGLQIPRLGDKQADYLVFFMEGELCSSFRMSIHGALLTENGWQQPLGLEFLTLYQVGAGIRLAPGPTGVTPVGFSIFGSLDIFGTAITMRLILDLSNPRQNAFEGSVTNLNLGLLLRWFYTQHLRYVDLVIKGADKLASIVGLGNEYTIAQREVSNSNIFKERNKKDPCNIFDGRCELPPRTYGPCKAQIGQGKLKNVVNSLIFGEKEAAGICVAKYDCNKAGYSVGLSAKLEMCPVSEDPAIDIVCCVDSANSEAPPTFELKQESELGGEIANVFMNHTLKVERPARPDNHNNPDERIGQSNDKSVFDTEVGASIAPCFKLHHDLAAFEACQNRYPPEPMPVNVVTLASLPLQGEVDYAKSDSPISGMFGDVEKRRAKKEEDKAMFQIILQHLYVRFAPTAVEVPGSGDVIKQGFEFRARAKLWGVEFGALVECPSLADGLTLQLEIANTRFQLEADLTAGPPPGHFVKLPMHHAFVAHDAEAGNGSVVVLDKVSFVTVEECAGTCLATSKCWGFQYGTMGFDYMSCTLITEPQQGTSTVFRNGFRIYQRVKAHSEVRPDADSPLENGLNRPAHYPMEDEVYERLETRLAQLHLPSNNPARAAAAKGLKHFNDDSAFLQRQQSSTDLTQGALNSRLEIETGLSRTNLSSAVRAHLAHKAQRQANFLALHKQKIVMYHQARQDSMIVEDLQAFATKMWNYMASNRDKIMAFTMNVIDSSKNLFRLLTRQSDQAQHISQLSSQFEVWRKERGLTKDELKGMYVVNTLADENFARTTAQSRESDASVLEVRVINGSPIPLSSQSDQTDDDLTSGIFAMVSGQLSKALEDMQTSRAVPLDESRNANWQWPFMFSIDKQRPIEEFLEEDLTLIIHTFERDPEKRHPSLMCSVPMHKDLLDGQLYPITLGTRECVKIIVESNTSTNLKASEYKTKRLKTSEKTSLFLEVRFLPFGPEHTLKPDLVCPIAVERFLVQSHLPVPHTTRIAYRFRIFGRILAGDFQWKFGNRVNNFWNVVKALPWDIIAEIVMEHMNTLIEQVPKLITAICDSLSEFYKDAIILGNELANEAGDILDDVSVFFNGLHRQITKVGYSLQKHHIAPVYNVVADVLHDSTVTVGELVYRGKKLLNEAGEAIGGAVEDLGEATDKAVTHANMYAKKVKRVVSAMWNSTKAWTNDTLDYVSGF